MKIEKNIKVITSTAEVKTSAKGNPYTNRNISGVLMDDPTEVVNYWSAGFTPMGQLMKDCKIGECYTVTMEESERGYWDWIAVEPYTGTINESVEKLKSVCPADPDEDDDETDVDKYLAEVRARRAAKAAAKATES